MISKVFLICLFSLNLGHAHAQEKASFRKNISSFTLSYGIGNIWKTFLNDAISQLPGVTYDVSATGPISLVYEYGILKRWSGGVAFSYSKVKGKFDGYGEKFTDKLTIVSGMLRVNYHLYVTEKFDVYAGGGAGLVFSKYNNDQSENRNSVPGLLGFSGQAGCKYFVLKSLALSAEVGYVNGSFGQLGITYQF